MDEKAYTRLLYYFINSVLENYKTIAGETLGKPQIENTKEEEFRHRGYVALVSFKGEMAGRAVIGVSDAIALKVAKGLTMEDVDEVSQTVLFSLAEFLNIVGGRAISLFNNEFKDKRIFPSPPSAFYGNNLRFVNFKVKGFNVVFPGEDGDFKLNIVVTEEKNG